MNFTYSNKDHLYDYTMIIVVLLTIIFFASCATQKQTKLNPYKDLIAINK